MPAPRLVAPVLLSWLLCGAAFAQDANPPTDPTSPAPPPTGPAAPSGSASPPASPAPTAHPAESIALELPLLHVPEAVYRLDADDIVELQTPEITEALELRVPGVQRNPFQENPFQQDLLFRGFLASPLVGAPIGLSAQLDGIRINEAFGDTVNWDLIPESALEVTEVVAGPDAVFGRNTLGGSIFVRTKDGFSHPRASLSGFGGSNERKAVAGEWGGNRNGFAWYLNGDWLDEDGWRRRTESELRRIFSKGSFRDDNTRVDITYQFADNDLVGNGLAPKSTLSQEWDEIYTFPDETHNRLHHASFTVSSAPTDRGNLRAQLFIRDYERKTKNGDVELECEDSMGNEIDVVPGLCEASGGELEPAGEDRETDTESLSVGGRVEYGLAFEPRQIPNDLVFGVSFDGSYSRFKQSEAEGDLFQEGLAWGIQRTEPFELETDVKSQQRNVGVFLRDAIELTPKLALTAAGRFDYVWLRLRDKSGDPDDADLNGTHNFHAFTGGGGLTYSPTESLVLFASYREGWRAPTPAELTCADPDDPCNLPNAFVADPPLDPVRVGSVEVGLRGELRPFGTRFSTAFYRSTLRDDILFVQAEVGGGGFFTNVSKTRRMGVEVQLVGARGPARWHFNYAWTDARYESFETLASPVDPAGIPISPGDRIPGVPEHAIVGSFAWALFPWWDVGVDTRWVSGQYLRGDDNNQFAKTPSFTKVNLRSRWELPYGFSLWGRITNLLDKKARIGGARNFNAFADPIDVERFLAPGPQRQYWIGLTWEHEGF